MKKEKLIGLSCVVIFLICIALFLISRHNERNLDDKENITITETDDGWGKIKEEAPESTFKFDEIEFSYEITDLDIKSLLEANTQLNYFQLTLYDYLFEYGYKEVKTIKVTEGKETVDNVQFVAYVTLKDGEEVVVKVDYDIQLLTFYYHFATEVETYPVELTGVDDNLATHISENQDEIEREFGKYLLEQKMDATEAAVKWYKKQEGQLIIQVELNDEFMTYCKIYYDLRTGEFEFKKWG